MEFTFDLTNIEEAAKAFVGSMKNRNVFAFYGEMGAGKTTLISEICRLLGAEDDFGSPTFSIVNEYSAKDGSPIYHFDFYRIDTLEEVIDMGADDYFYSGHLCLLEWPEKIGNLLPEEAVVVNIKVNPDATRTLTIADEAGADR